MYEPGEVTLDLRAIPQPDPKIFGGGDCGACVLAGIFGISIQEVYERKGEVQPFSSICMRDWLYEANPSRLIDDTPYWQRSRSNRVWGDPGWMQSLPWGKYAQMAIDAGYYGIASVDHGRQGDCRETDHVVLICGCRVVQIQVGGEVPHKRIDTELLISCSAKHPDGKWVEVNEFLRNWGGFNALWVKP